MKIFFKLLILVFLILSMAYAGSKVGMSEGEGADDDSKDSFDMSHCYELDMTFQIAVCINEEKEKYYQKVASLTTTIVSGIKRMPEKYHYLVEDLLESDALWKNSHKKDCHVAAEFAYPLSPSEAKRANDNEKGAALLQCVVDNIKHRIEYLVDLNKING